MKNNREKSDRIKSLIEEFKPKETEYIKTDSTILDSILGDGSGVVRGSVNLISGPHGVGKNTVALHISRSFCNQDYKVLYLDVGGKLNKNVLDSMGLIDYIKEPKKFVGRYDSDEENSGGEFILENIQTFSRLDETLEGLFDEDKYIDLIVVDSITSLLPERMVGNPVKDASFREYARITIIFLLKYKALFAKKGITVLLLSNLKKIKNKDGYYYKESYSVRYHVDCSVSMDYLSEKTSGRNNNQEVVREIQCKSSRRAKSFDKEKIHIIFGEGVIGGTIMGFINNKDNRIYIKKRDIREMNTIPILIDLGIIDAEFGKEYDAYYIDDKDEESIIGKVYFNKGSDEEYYVTYCPLKGNKYLFNTRDLTVR